MKFDSYQMVTDRICALLEQGVKPWAQPWTSIMDCAWSGCNGKPYSLLNQMLLADPEKKYTSMDELLADIRGEWVTFHQALERGGSVRKGEHGRRIVFYKMMTKDKTNPDDKDEQFPYLTAYTVFRIDQCDGLKQKYHLDDDTRFDFTGDDNADRIANDYIARENIKFQTKEGSHAYYRPSEDLVVLPLPEQFSDVSEYYSTLFHELTHSTGHPKRLNRINDTAAYGNQDYSREELVAEIGSASLMATLGIESKNSFTNSTAYIAGWLKALKSDRKMIVWASSRAESAVRMILNMTNGGDKITSPPTQF